MRAKVTREAWRWWRGTSDVHSISPAIEIANRNESADWHSVHAALLEQVRPSDIEERRSPTYDRRSPERRAADEAAARRSTDVSPPPVPPRQMRERVAAVLAETLAAERPVAPPLKQRAAVVIRPKPIPRSRTVWLNGLTVLAAGSVIASDVLGVLSVGLTVPEQAMMWVLFGVGVVNILLRFETCYPIGNPIVYRSPIKAPTSSAARPLSGVIKGTR